MSLSIGIPALMRRSMRALPACGAMASTSSTRSICASNSSHVVRNSSPNLITHRENLNCILLRNQLNCGFLPISSQCASSAAITSSGGSISYRRASFLPTTQRSVNALRYANGFHSILRNPRIASSCNSRFLNVRGDATLAGKETLLATEAETEVQFRILFWKNFGQIFNRKI